MSDTVDLEPIYLLFDQIDAILKDSLTTSENHREALNNLAIAQRSTSRSLSRIVDILEEHAGKIAVLTDLAELSDNASSADNQH